MRFLGDVFIDKTYDVDIELDNFVFNLEYPLSCHGKPAKNKVNLCQRKSYIKETFGKNPLAVCLANNHIMDYGEEAFLETIKFLKAEGIGYFGAGTEENNYNNPYIIHLEKKTIALLGYSCPTTHPVFGSKKENGSAVLDEAKILEDIEAIKNKVDFIVIQLHWGDEEIKYPKPDDVRKARLFVDAGADLIIGHHAHVIQSMEIYNGKKIFYGIGNFLFPNLDTPSMFNGSEFTRKYKKIQNSKNRKSIIVELNDTLDTSYKTTYFDDKIVFLQKTKIPSWIPGTEKSYRLYYKLWQRKRMIELYLKNPRVPSFKQIRLFLGINR